MSGALGGLGNVTTLLRQLVQALNGTTAAVKAAAPVTASQPANQVLASPVAGAGTSAFRNIDAADLNAATGSVAANQFLASPTGAGGALSFRAITQADLGAIANTTPLFSSNSANFTSGGTVAITSGALMAPSNGIAIVFALVQQVQGFGQVLSLTSSLSGIVSSTTPSGSPFGAGIAYLPMAKGQSSTFTFSAEYSSTYSGWSQVNLWVFFLPLA